MTSANDNHGEIEGPFKADPDADASRQEFYELVEFLPYIQAAYPAMNENRHWQRMVARINEEYAELCAAWEGD